ncbi:MAG: 16S rRNA (adenine(1518)-N(6)/adenine(1519)-N(6))-dimethyltransferase RsmA [Desulfovibrio sp.]|jgi:16S rRNA (adenine1518-N6/adenine1519-N6)-dimethyltransferase|nr:16S rRNA (adenine(1518)-N(6)/adenine(1519)-N(6))-dimethyltransferase RsmA [Desulfovibrio sp.]
MKPDYSYSRVHNPRRAGASPRPRKSLGQHFLKDANIARKIVRALDIGPKDSVLEIGPGAGALTEIVRERNPARFVLLEKDAYWARERMDKGRVSVILADALAFAWERFSDPWKFLGNLPYNVASPLIWELVSRSPGFAGAVFMVQKEVGLRLAAGPGKAAYGALSVWVQSFTVPRLEFFVPPQVFFPRPKVDSAVLSLSPRAPRPFSPAALARTLRLCFQNRRKQLGTTIRAAGGEARLLEDLGIDPRLRPEALPVEAFHLLAGTGIFCRRD